jgi:uncharacterized protein (DUF1800 family)
MRFPSNLRLLAAALLSLQLAVPADILAQAATAPATAPAVAPQDNMKQDSMSPPAETLHAHPTPQNQIPKDERLLLVLDRFTYGPRPGDLQHLRDIGLNAWFQQQLNPASIDDSALDARLAAYPAMQLPLDKLMELYPTNQQIRASLDHRVGIPGGDAAHAIYHDQQERYKDRKADKAQKTADPNAPKPPPPVVELPKSPQEILALPPDQRFKALCHLTLPQLRELRRTLPADQRDQLTSGFTPAQVEAIAAFNGPSGVIRAEDVQVKLLRDVYSERQLQEVMVDFWLNHFNVYMNKSQDAPYYIAAYERQAIRPRALGRFEDLLISTATSPAMLNYLDNSSSVGPHSAYATGNYGFYGRGPRRKDVGLNENYAREVMELHSVGVNGGYTQRDVTELAKVFTGWTVGRRPGQDVPAQAQYDPSKHEPGPKVVMGNKIKENGQKEGLEVLRMLAASPQCARFISTKLAVRFVSDTPPPAMIERMTQTYLDTHGAIRQVLLSMVNSPEFFTAATYRAKLKTPQEFVISAVRASGAQVDSTAGMAAAIEQLGMPLYGHQTPDGYSMKAEAWNSTTQLVSRMNFAMALATNRVSGLHADPDTLLKRQMTDSDATPASLSPLDKTTALEAVLLHDPITPRTQQLILAQVSTDRSQQTSELRQIAAIRGGDPLQRLDAAPAKPLDPVTTDPQAALATGLILGSPEFQRR